MEIRAPQALQFPAGDESCPLPPSTRSIRKRTAKISDSDFDLGLPFTMRPDLYCVLLRKFPALKQRFHYFPGLAAASFRIVRAPQYRRRRFRHVANHPDLTFRIRSAVIILVGTRSKTTIEATTCVVEYLNVETFLIEGRRVAEARRPPPHIVHRLSIVLGKVG